MRDMRSLCSPVSSFVRTVRHPTSYAQASPFSPDRSSWVSRRLNGVYGSYLYRTCFCPGHSSLLCIRPRRWTGDDTSISSYIHTHTHTFTFTYIRSYTDRLMHALYPYHSAHSPHSHSVTRFFSFLSFRSNLHTHTISLLHPLWPSPSRLVPVPCFAFHTCPHVLLFPTLGFSVVVRRRFVLLFVLAQWYTGVSCLRHFAIFKISCKI